MSTITTTRKYTSIINFINKSSSFIQENFSLVMSECNAVEKVDSNFNINDTCFYCNYCYFGSLTPAYKQKFKEIKEQYYSSIFFKGKKIELPFARNFIATPRNKNLDTFTSFNETRRIQPWATALFQNCSNQNTITAIEIPVQNREFDRDGRIDIGATSHDFFLFIEAKTTLQDAMNDERFVEQYEKYIQTITEYLQLKSFVLLLLIGGEEKELYPQGSAYNPFGVGDLTKRFYNLLENNGNRIPFISASALWALSIKFMEDPSFNMVKFIHNLFLDKNTFGLLTSGAVVKSNNQFDLFDVNI